MQKKALGRGLESLIPSLAANKAPAGEAVITIALNKIKPNRFQPRQNFDKSKLQELADSINKHGLAQPILVAPSISPGEYEIIAGERRFRASKMAGKKDIRAIVQKSADDKKRFDIALIENLQRQDLDAIEEAKAYKRLIEEFNHTHDDIAEIVGKDRSVITNTLRLLVLPEDIQILITEGKISAGHGRMLAGIEEEAELRALVEQIVEEKLSVRATEKIVSKSKLEKGTKSHKKQEIEIVHLQEEIQRKLGTKVNISGSSKKGKIEIYYYSLEELERIAKELNCNI
ncbi:MAG: ParB/RepB/Spo0J family partition protein [Endomicrobia bacterium]|nr:ParB/RepB/Spo0J family partition protein [Endomicrobiia bacterium]MCL2506308.1 ParB/RepB/Spo0J family partition protein [Endomicrobiia bacterium]